MTKHTAVIDRIAGKAKVVARAAALEVVRRAAAHRERKWKMSRLIWPKWQAVQDATGAGR